MTLYTCIDCGGTLAELKRVWTQLPHFQCSHCGKIWVLVGTKWEECLQPAEHLERARELANQGERKAAQRAGVRPKATKI